MTLYSAGAPLKTARAAVVMVHGRGSNAEDILGLAGEFGQHDLAYVAPQAPRNTWYPYSFLAPFEQNEPYLTAGLEMLGDTVKELARAGFGPERVALIGFSQGGCLALEYVARNPYLYGAVAGLSAGLIGPPGTPRQYQGTLAGAPVFLGCSDIDSHIPLERVHETRDVLRALGGRVTERIYPGFGHSVNEDEIAHVRDMLAGVNAMA